MGRNSSKHFGQTIRAVSCETWRTVLALRASVEDDCQLPTTTANLSSVPSTRRSYSPSCCGGQVKRGLTPKANPLFLYIQQ